MASVTTIPSTAIAPVRTTGTQPSPLVVSTARPAAQAVQTISTNLNTITDAQARAQLAREAENLDRFGNAQGIAPTFTPQQMSQQAQQQMEDRVRAQSVASPGQVVQGAQTGTNPDGTPKYFQAYTAPSAQAPAQATPRPSVPGVSPTASNQTRTDAYGYRLLPSGQSAPMTRITLPADASGLTYRDVLVPVLTDASGQIVRDTAGNPLPDESQITQEALRAQGISESSPRFGEFAASYQTGGDSSAFGGPTALDSRGGTFGQFSDALAQLNRQTDEAYHSYQQQMLQIQNGTFPLTEDQQGLLNSIKSQFESMTTVQQQANQAYVNAVTQAGISAGRNRYAPEVELGNIQGAVNAGIQKINDINRQAIETTLTAKAAIRKENYEMANKAYDRLSKLIEDKKSEMFNLVKIVSDQEEKTRQYNFDLMKFNEDVKFRQQDFELKMEQFDRQMQMDNFRNMLDLNKFTYQQTRDQQQFGLEADKFAYQRGQDAIENALRERQLTQQEADSLRDYNFKLEQLRQGRFIVTQDAFGNPMAFNTRSGQFENSALPPVPTVGGGTGAPGTQGTPIFQPENYAYLDALRNASIGMTDSARKQLMGQANELLQARDFPRLQELLTRVATKNSPAEQQTAALGRVQAIAALNDIQTIMNAYIQQTGDTGILRGNVEKFANRLGESSDPRLKALQTQITMALQAYRNSITGKAFTEAETREYKTIFPDITNAGTLNTAMIGAAIRSFTGQQKAFLSGALGGSNYDMIFPPPKASSIVEWSRTYPERWDIASKFIQDNNLDEAEALQFLNNLTSPSQEPMPPAPMQLPTMDREPSPSPSPNMFMGGGGGIDMGFSSSGSTTSPFAPARFNSPLGMGVNGPADAKRVAAAIGQFESGGRYTAIGPTVTSGRYKGDRAYGKYQIMGLNVPEWTREVFGYAMTPQEFLKNPKAQDAVAEFRMARLLKKHGTVEDVASVWFTGQPLKKAGNVKDVLGTTAPQYVKNVRAIYNRIG